MVSNREGVLENADYLVADTYCKNNFLTSIEDPELINGTHWIVTKQELISFRWWRIGLPH